MKKAWNGIWCLTKEIDISKYEKFPNEIETHSFNIENSIYSNIKLYTPLEELVDEKFFGSKRSFPHKLFYTKLFAFAYPDDYDYKSINIEEYDFKAFPQIYLNIKFYGQKININSNGYLSIAYDSKNYSKFLYNINNTNYYQVIINDKSYLFIVVINNSIEINGIFKSNKDFDLKNTFKCKVLYIKNKNNIYNYMENHNNKSDFIIKNGSTILFDIKSTYAVSDLIKQIKFHDSILYNIYKSCNENLDKYFYFCILTNKEKTESKKNILKNFLNEAKVKLNIIIIQTKNSNICGSNFDFEFLAKNIMVKIDGLESKIDGLESKIDGLERKINFFIQKQERMEKRYNEMEENQGKIVKTQDRMELRLNNIEEELKSIKNNTVTIERINNLEESILSRLNNNRNIFSYFRRLFTGTEIKYIIVFIYFFYMYYIN